ncbi:hypothetical protein KKC88_04045 [Patescibacteria group bacterium]|nr:hypothetical protein [Patescibacteria group bacterium]MBU1672984.1 hypothetical protein [Patescibacteria group bacterium]MBU1962981.1 hypothetical protein [Patescibacteria group bacterium]
MVKNQKEKKYKVQIGEKMAPSAAAFAAGFIIAAMVLIPIIYWMSGR